MQLDPSLYVHHLDGMDMSDADKLAFMEALWAILSTFVDRAWGDTSEQILLGIKRRDAAKQVPLVSIDPLDSEPALASTFSHAAGNDARESDSR